MTDPTKQSRARRPVVRVAVGVAALFTAWHLFASFLWISPPTPLRELVPGNLLTQYMIPWFGQSWSVFAPAPINGDSHLEVRAEVTDGGTATTTKWVDAVDVEWQMAHHNLMPPQAANLANLQARELRGAWDGLNEQQRKIAAQGYYKGDDWLDREMTAMKSVGSNTEAVNTYITCERYINAYATQVARAIWGQKVSHVQYRASRQAVIPFEQRNKPGITKPSRVYYDFGWRGLIVLPGQDEAAFKEVFLPLYKSYEAAQK
jgi:hypothetical protein